MQLGRIRGCIVATQKIERLSGVRLVVVEPLDSNGKAVGPPFAAIDVVAAGMGQVIYWVGSREASVALPAPYPAVDAAVVGIVDRIDLLACRGTVPRGSAS